MRGLNDNSAKHFRRDKTEFVLEFLGGVVDDMVSLTGDIASAFFDSYPSRRGGHSRERGSCGNGAPSREEYQRFYNILSRLQRDDLIAKKKQHGNQLGWGITKKGFAKLFSLREKKKFSPSRVEYVPKKDLTFRVVIFDIPERERHKREWLRSALLALGFSMCQQSVWVGKQKIPKKFLKDLYDREMLSYVQIFEITKQGSLERMV
ncbi:MAG: CRISPR-associated endonuclease Cas2 [Nanoarchaeota archaeon]|nr:CRISPR-associated endonuclease Cas2 [Nanoarchaeota archaeon]